MRRQGFTLVELLVVIAIIALLMGILMPALSRARQLAFRLTCGTNLAGIGKAMMVYAHDNEGELPRAGTRDSTWGPLPDWLGASRYSAYGLGCGGRGPGQASITSCFYLLAKYVDVTPKSFVCRADTGTTEFRLSELPQGTVPRDCELVDCWDFGPSAEAWTHCSYAYHMPFGLYALTTSDEPGAAVAADRSPWITSPAGEPSRWSDFHPDIDPYRGSSEAARQGNAIAHQRDGQNVLFLDTHVEFARRAYCAIEDDNIYTISRFAAERRGDPLGTAPAVGATQPASRNDALLVHDFIDSCVCRLPR